MVFEPVACVHGMQKTLPSGNVLGGKTTHKCITHKPWQDRYKTFQETVRRQFIELKIREGKNEAEFVF